MAARLRRQPNGQAINQVFVEAFFMSSVRAAVRALLDDMDAVCKQWPELTDTEVRGAMRDDITDGFIDPKPGFVLPDDYGLSTPEGDAAVRAALARFLADARTAAEQEGLLTPTERLRAFQCNVQSAAGSEYDLYFNSVE
jgi:hypothetical protein